LTPWSAGPGLSPGPALALALGLALLAGCDRPGTPSAQVGAAPPVAAGYERERRNLDAAIEAGLELAAKRPDDGLLPVELVSLYQERAHLTGDYDDYRHAERLLERHAAAARSSAPYCLARARLHFSLHRLEQAGAALDACPATAEASEVAALRGDIALYSGRYREAEATFRALANDPGLPQHFVRLALLRSKVGAPAEAAALLEAAERRYHGVSATMKAWLKLQRGLVALDRGRFDEALAMYRLAGDALPGWWLVDEHVAQVASLRGDPRTAKSLYAGVVERTQAPEFMDALARIEREEGRAARAHELLQRARAIHEKRLSDFPEAAAGHALDHFLQEHGDSRRALALAQANFANRPHGEAAIALARAWMLTGKPERALPVVEAQLEAGWDTPEAHWVLAQALQRAGKPERAADARARALRMNPESGRMY
jgi:tetratricopeptide (TPR) repeat protein